MIRLPWVSRESFDIALGAERRRADAEHENAQHLRHQLSDLASRYHMLKLQGATEALLAPAPPDKPFDPVMSAVNSACAGKDVKVRRAMLAAVARDRAAGVSADDIILRIARGNRVADELEPVDSTPNHSATASAP